MNIDNSYPLKFAILYVMAKEKRELSPEDVMEKLRPIYNSEKAFTMKNIRFHLDSMGGIDMLKMTNEYIDENGILNTSFIITPFGMERTAMLPEAWQKNL